MVTFRLLSWQLLVLLLVCWVNMHNLDLCKLHRSLILTGDELKIDIQLHMYMTVFQVLFVHVVMQILLLCDLGKSVWSRICDIFNVLFDWSAHLESVFCWKPHLNRTSGSKVMSSWRILKKIENKRNSLLFLAISHKLPMLATSDWFR